MAPDGRLLVSTTRATYAIDAQTLRVVRRYPVGGGALAISPDGATLALGGANPSEDGGVRLLDLASGRVERLRGRHRGGLVFGAFSPDGRTLSSGTGSGEVVVWDVQEGRAIERLEGHHGTVWMQAFSPDGRTLYTAGDDSNVFIWDAAGDRRLGRPFRTSTPGAPAANSPPFAVSPDGRTLAVARIDGRVDLIDAETLRRTGSFETFADRSALAVEYSPNGSRLAVAGAGGGVGLWDAVSGKRAGPPLRASVGAGRHDPRSVYALAFGQGGLLAAAAVGGAVRTWDLDRRELVGRPMHLGFGVKGLAFSPDGSKLAIPLGYRFREETPTGVEVRDPRSGERLARLRSNATVRSVAFSPDGRLLAGGLFENGSALVWATDDWHSVGQPLFRGGGEQDLATLGLAFSSDGRTLATSHDGGTVSLWDVESQQPMGSPLPGLPDGGAAARFTPDGARLFALSATGRAIRWELDPEIWAQHACTVAGELTLEQWDEVVPEQDYLSVCPSG